MNKIDFSTIPNVWPSRTDFWNSIADLFVRSFSISELLLLCTGCSWVWAWGFAQNRSKIHVSKGVCIEALTWWSTVPAGYGLMPWLETVVCLFLCYSSSLSWLGLPLQVSKLYEVVPPILTELGKVLTLNKRDFNIIELCLMCKTKK